MMIFSSVFCLGASAFFFVPQGRRFAVGFASPTTADFFGLPLFDSTGVFSLFTTDFILAVTVYIYMLAKEL